MPKVNAAKVCKPGQIIRKGYTRKAYYRADGTYVSASKVKPVCITDQGNPGKGLALIGKMKKGELTQFGYHLSSNVTYRRKALTKAIKRYDALSVFRKINAISILQKNTNPSYSAKARADANWISKNYHH